jgi:hypothetical protein
VPLQKSHDPARTGATGTPHQRRADNVKLTLAGILIGALISVVAGLFVWRVFFRPNALGMLETQERLTAALRIRDELLEGIADITGQRFDAEVPEDWPKRLRESVQAKAEQLSTANAKTLLCLAAELVRDVDPPRYATSRARAESLVHAHERLIRILGSAPIEGAGTVASITQNLRDGEFDMLFRISHRLAAYFPDRPETRAYAVAAAAVAATLARDGILVLTPPLLTPMGPDAVTSDVSEVSDLREVPDAARRISDWGSRAAQAAKGMGGNVVAIDCVSPGWKTASESCLPCMRLWDAAWQSGGG